MCLGSCEAATALSGIPRDSAQGRKGLMKRFVSILIYSICTITAHGQQHDSPAQAIVHVATAVNHLTVLEFHEPVTMAAAGSSDFQIERQDSKVFIKPTRSGVSTDLFVWTASRRFAYELETTQELKNMNFAIDNSLPVPPPVVSSGADELADMMLTRAFIGAVEIRSSRSRSSTDKVSVRIEQVFRTRTTAYIHYTIDNNSKGHLRRGIACRLSTAGQSFFYFCGQSVAHAIGSAHDQEARRHASSSAAGCACRERNSGIGTGRCNRGSRCHTEGSDLAGNGASGI